MPVKKNPCIFMIKHVTYVCYRISRENISDSIAIITCPFLVVGHFSIVHRHTEDKIEQQHDIRPILPVFGLSWPSLPKVEL